MAHKVELVPAPPICHYNWQNVYKVIYQAFTLEQSRFLKLKLPHPFSEYIYIKNDINSKFEIFFSKNKTMAAISKKNFNGKNTTTA